MFLSPFFLIAAAAGAAVPLILHLMQTRKRAKLPFPTLRFLRAARKQSSRRIKIENFLLWLIRTLIMIAIGMAFAMPILRNRGFSWLGEAPRDIAIVIDASYSMHYDTGRETVWDKALDAARSLIEELPEGDRFCLFLAREQPEALVAAPIGDKEEGLSRLKDLPHRYGPSQLAPALVAAANALRKDGGRRELELHVLTDNQALPWESFDSGKPGARPAPWNPDLLDGSTGLFVTALGVPAPRNTAPAAVDLQPPVVRPGSAARVSASLNRTGESVRTTVTLFIDDEERARRSVEPGAPPPEFLLPPLPLGIHTGRIETPRDNLSLDDSFHFLVRVEEQPPALCVGAMDDTLFLRTALQAAAGDGETVPPVIPPDQLASEPLRDYSCLFLCNALPVTGQAVEAVEAYVRAGGLLVLFPGNNASPDDYRPWNCLPGVPDSVTEVPVSLRRRTLAWDQPRHPMVRPLRESAGIPPLAVRRSLAWEHLHDHAARLVSMGPGRPFLLERPFGDGRVLMFAVAADRSWSDFPLSPFYLPLLAQCVDFGAGLGARPPCHWTASSLPLTGLVREIPRGATLEGPGKISVPIRRTTSNTRPLHVAEDLAVPGIYRLAPPSRPGTTPVLAVNLPRRESDLTPVSLDELPARLGVDHLYVATSIEELRRAIREHRVGRTFGEHLLWAALALVVVEFFYANALLRKSPRQSAILETGPAGRIAGHP